jgi:hypothetical protein
MHSAKAQKEKKNFPSCISIIAAQVLSMTFWSTIRHATIIRCFANAIHDDP